MKGFYMNNQTSNDIQSFTNISKWLSLKDAVQYSGLSDSSLRRAIQTGRLKANKVGHKWLIKSEWIEGFLNS